MIQKMLLSPAYDRVVVSFSVPGIKRNTVSTVKRTLEQAFPLLCQLKQLDIEFPLGGYLCHSSSILELNYLWILQRMVYPSMATAAL